MFKQKIADVGEKAGVGEKAITANRHRLSAKKRATIYTLLMFAFILALAISFIVFSKNINATLGWPEAKAGIYDALDHKDNPTLCGEWELFYNKWIVTDGIDCERDAFIELPDRWTGMTLADGTVLGRSGFASYRLIVKNLGSDVSFAVFNQNYVGAYRVFVNRQLITEYGVVSKDPKETRSSGMPQNVGTYTATSADPIEIIIEVSASNEGGFHATPWMMRQMSDLSAFTFVNTIGIWAFGFLCALFLVNIGMNIGSKNNHMWSLTAFLALLILLLATSIDLFWQFAQVFKWINYNVIAEVFYAVSVAVGFAFINHILRTKLVTLPKGYVILSIVLNIACVISFYLLKGSNFRIIPVMLQIAYLDFIFYPLFLSITKRVKYSSCYIFILFALSFIFAIMSLDVLDVIIFGAESAIAIAMMVVMTAVTAMYWMMLLDKSKKALKAVEFEKEVMTVKTQALKAQIKPHFVFNSLTSIQNLYHQSLKKGDEAMAMFSNHLRLNIDADNKEIVTFEEELRNINNYCALESMRVGYDIPLLFDNEITNFQVPILSLQPLVENAIKYSKINEKENGYIQIASYEKTDSIVVEVRDNGVGFDQSTVTSKSTGIKNITERFKFMMNATVSTKSEVDVGTTVKIEIPKIKNEIETKQKRRTNK
ncbi:MAG: histidine kinase [Clostridia bacterium]